MTIPETMRAVVIDAYGEPDVLKLRHMPLPVPAAGEVLIRVAFAGVGVWDVGERSGAMAGMLPAAARIFPRIIGGDGSGTVVVVGDGVEGFAVGDAVYASTFAGPKGGFYAEYTAVPSSQVAKLPHGLDMAAASAVAITGVTALRGLTDTLRLKGGDRLLIFGAAGGVGHAAVQLAKALGAHVLAVVSNDEGAALVRAAGADVIVNSKADPLASTIASFAPDGLDAVLAAVSGSGLEEAITGVREGGRIAFPHGVQPVPVGPSGVDVIGYDGTVDREVLDRLNGLIGSGPFTVQITKRFPLEDAAAAHTWLSGHHPGRTILVVE